MPCCPFVGWSAGEAASGYLRRRGTVSYTHPAGKEADLFIDVVDKRLGNLLRRLCALGQNALELAAIRHQLIKACLERSGKFLQRICGIDLEVAIALVGVLLHQGIDGFTGQRGLDDQ